MRKPLGYILGALGVVLLIPGGVGIVLGAWFGEANWIAQATGTLAIGGALIGGARYVLRRHAAALKASGSAPA